MHIYRDVNGPHTCRAVGSTVWINGQAVATVEGVLFPRLSRDGRVVFKGHETGAAYVVTADGQHVCVTPETIGNWPCAWGHDGALYVQVGVGQVMRYVDDGGAWLGARADVVDYASEGIHHITADGHVVLGNQVGRDRGWGAQPRYLWHADEDASGIVALSDGDDPSPWPGCVVWLRPDAEPLMWCPPSDIPHPPRISHGRIAISGDDTPEPDAIPWVPYARHEPARPTLPAPPSDLPAMWIGFVADQGLPADGRYGNCSWSAFTGAASDLPVTEMRAWADSIWNRPLLCGLWLSDNGAPADSVRAQIEFATARHAKAVYLHCDDERHRPTVLEAAQIVEAAGLVPIMGLHVNAGVPPPAPAMGAMGLLGVTLNIRTWGKDLQQLAAGVQWVFTAGPAVVFIFGWDDCAWPELREWIATVVARVPRPAAYPGVIMAPVVPVDPPAPIAPEPRHSRGHGGQARRSNAPAVALAGGLGVAVAWLWRKLRPR